MTATIKDVAKKTGVSTATVSRALNNEYGVKPETREKVLAVARDFGYTPNAVARGLVKSQTESIGLIIPDISNPFYPEIVKGVEAAAEENGYNIFFCNTNYNKDKQYQYMRLLEEKRVDGIILAPGPEDAAAFDDRAAGIIPVVYLCKRLTAPDKSLVAIDDERGGFLATKHLIEQGYQSIGFIGAHDNGFSAGERFRGYQQAFEKCGRLQCRRDCHPLPDVPIEPGCVPGKRQQEIWNEIQYPHPLLHPDDWTGNGDES